MSKQTFDPAQVRKVARKSNINEAPKKEEPKAPPKPKGITYKYHEWNCPQCDGKNTLKLVDVESMAFCKHGKFECSQCKCEVITKENVNTQNIPSVRPTTVNINDATLTINGGAISGWSQERLTPDGASLPSEQRILTHLQMSGRMHRVGVDIGHVDSEVVYDDSGIIYGGRVRYVEQMWFGAHRVDLDRNFNINAYEDSFMNASDSQQRNMCQEIFERYFNNCAVEARRFHRECGRPPEEFSIVERNRYAPFKVMFPKMLSVNRMNYSGDIVQLSVHDMQQIEEQCGNMINGYWYALNRGDMTLRLA